MIDPYQYYPTPPTLSKRAWAKFKDRDFIRVLEPSAGEGHLLTGRPAYGWQKLPIDCIEIDISKHQSLREQGYAVVGMDFLTFTRGSMYSHVLMNPPFAEGAKHVLKAWDILFEGEIVAILNAETLKNPFSKERKGLLNLIEQYGDVEYLTQMFAGHDVERKTEVDIALVWLKKNSRFEEEILGNILSDLNSDQFTEDSLADGFTELNLLALPQSFVENAVLMFNAAVESAKQAVMAEARANRYRKMLGKTLAEFNGHADHDNQNVSALNAGRYRLNMLDENNSSVHWVKQQLYSRYLDLKDRAWSGILCSTQATSKLSSSAQKRLQADFEFIKALEFTVANIYGFFQGILDKQDAIQIGMICDVFDLIIRYHSENASFYLGWKSNDKHRTLGMRIKTTRFVIPGHKTESYQKDLSWDSGRMLADIDKVFALLDGKREPELSLEAAFSQYFQELRNGGRIKASYFDVRYYPGIGTIHFFPTHKKLVDRINWVVGSHRRWLPPVETQAGPSFWKQYHSAEKFDKAFRAEVGHSCRQMGIRYAPNPFWAIRYGQETEQQQANDLLSHAMASVLEQNGIHPDDLLEEDQKNSLLLEHGGVDNALVALESGQNKRGMSA